MMRCASILPASCPASFSCCGGGGGSRLRLCISAGPMHLKARLSYLKTAEERCGWGGAEGAAEGLTYFDGSQFISPLGGTFPKVLINGMAEDSEGGIWIASNGGIYRLLHRVLEKVLDGNFREGNTAIGGDVFLAAVARPGKNPATETDLVRVSRSHGLWRNDVLVQSTLRAKFSLGRLGKYSVSMRG